MLFRSLPLGVGLLTLLALTLPETLSRMDDHISLDQIHIISSSEDGETSPWGQLAVPEKQLLLHSDRIQRVWLPQEQVPSLVFVQGEKELLLEEPKEELSEEMMLSDETLQNEDLWAQRVQSAYRELYSLQKMGGVTWPDRKSVV